MSPERLALGSVGAGYREAYVSDPIASVFGGTFFLPFALPPRPFWTFSTPNQLFEKAELLLVDLNNKWLDDE